MYNCVKLGTLTRIRTGKLDANASSTDGAYPFFTCSREVLRIATYSYDCECVLVAGNGDLNVKYYAGKFDAYQRTYIIESIDKSKLLTKYLYLFLDIYVEVLRTQSIGGVIKYIKLGNLADALIPLPGIEKQAEIVDCLETCNVIIDRIQQQLTKLDELVKSRFVEMFENDRFPYTTIGNLIERKVGAAKKDFASTDTIKYIDISSIDNKRNMMTGYTEYILADAPSRAQQHICKGDIVVSTVRPNLKNVASTPFDDDNLVASSGFCVLRPRKCLPSYLMAVVCSDEFTKAMTNVVTGANYPAIKDSDVMNYPVRQPPMDLQQEFAAFVAEVDKSKLAVKQSLEKLETLKKSLMQQYFG